MEKANGGLNGSAKANGITSMNGHATSPGRKPALKPRRSFLSWSFSMIARLLTWYSIITVLFRCPATLDQCTEASPRICRPYFQLKHAVSPHLEPYYNTYAAPYVEIARPYYDTVDERVLTPSWAYATKYGGPRLAQAQAFGQTQWENNIQPEITKYQALAKVKYDQTLAPHVNQVSSVIAPYYDLARTNALQTYQDLVLPSYVFVQPYVLQGYATASTFTTGTAIPSAAWAWNKTYVFLNGTVWPQLRFLYAENVEPQLVKIGQRLGRYNSSNTHKASEAVTSAAAKATSTVTELTSIASSASATPVSTDAVTSASEPRASAAAPASAEDAATHTDTLTEKIKEGEIPAPEPSPDESDIRKIARETVAEDLKAWQDKYARAADEGAAEIDDRIDEISKRMIDRQAHSMGRSLVKQLQESVDAEVKTLKADIIQIISTVKTGAEEPESALEQINAAVRRAGLEIKDKSQDVRSWSENYEKELQATVIKAAENHFNILEGIRDLALQKIGMKWAWMDGVTYKDWAKYHQLKSRFDEWEDDLKELITSHPGLQAAEDEGRAVEGRAMDLAQTAAKQLATLKQVAALKLAIHDDSDNFDPESTQLAFEEAEAAKASAAAAAEAVDDAEAVDPEEVVEPEAIDAETTTPADETLVSDSEEASSSVAPSQAPEEAEDTPDLASTITLEETPVFVDNTTEATTSAEPAPVRLPVDEEGADPADEVAEPIDDVVEPVEDDVIPTDHPESSQTTASVKSAFLGAAAQSVPSRQPVLDNDDDDDDDDVFAAAGSIISAMQSDVPATISSAASSAYSAAMSGAAERYSQALSLVSAQISGTPKPAHEELLSSVTSAYGNAVSIASSRLDAALSAATEVFATTTSTDALPALPTLADWARVESIAVQRLSEGQAWASEQYESAKVAIGLATPTPTSGISANAEWLLENAQHNYYAGLGFAQARYSEFLAAASSALSSVTATPTPTNLAGTISSVASVASESAASAVSVVGDTANWSAVVDQISAQIYGQPTPTAWYSSLYSAASDYAASANEVVGNSVEAATSAAGDYTEAVTSAAGDYAAAASSKASEQYVVVSSILSELLVGKEPTFSESVYSRLAGAYSGATSSASSFASAASETISSVATEATEAVKEATQNVKDEL